MNKRASGVRMHVSSLPGVPNGNWAFRVTQEQNGTYPDPLWK